MYNYGNVNNNVNTTSIYYSVAPSSYTLRLLKKYKNPPFNAFSENNAD